MLIDLSKTSSNHRRIFAASGLVVFGLIIAGCLAYIGSTSHRATEKIAATAADPVTGPVAAVAIDNFTFTPDAITVAPGTTVKWLNRDDVPHTVTSNNKSFASGALDTDATFAHQFTTPGTYDYFCAVHPHMTGRVIVK